MDSFSLCSSFLASPLTLTPSTLSSSLPIRRPSTCHRLILAVHSSSKSPKPQTLANSPNSPNSLLDLARNPLSILIISLSLSFSFFPFPSPKFRPIAIAAPATRSQPRSNPNSRRQQQQQQEQSAPREHEFSGYTKNLLLSVSVLLSRIDDVRNSRGKMDAVNQALKLVKARRKDIQREVIGKLNADLNELKLQKEELVKRSGEVFKEAVAAKRERDEVLKEGAEGNEEVKRLEGVICDKEGEYNRLWEKVGEIEDQMLRKETFTLSIAVRELGFIERESELLVDRFNKQLREKSSSRY